MLTYNANAALVHDGSNFDKAVAAAHVENGNSRGPCFVVDLSARRCWKVEGTSREAEVTFEELPHAISRGLKDEWNE